MTILEEISIAIQNVKRKDAKKLVSQAIEEGFTAQQILNDGLMAGMDVIGGKFIRDEVFVPEVLVAARAMNTGTELLKPLLKEEGVGSIGKACIGTVQGDLHDIGKNLVKLMMESKNIEMIDLGVYVAPETFIETAINEKCDTLAALSMMDLSVEAQAFGADIRVVEGELPTVVGAYITDPEEAEELEIPEVSQHRTWEYVQAVGQVAKECTDRPVFAGAIGPFTLAGRLQDVSEALMNCYDEPEMVHTLLEKSTAFIISYWQAFKAAGASGVMLAEPLCGIISPAAAREFSHPYVKRVIDAVQDEDFIVIYHNCGSNTVAMAPDLAELGAKGYHLGNSIDMADILPLLPEDSWYSAISTP